MAWDSVFGREGEGTRQRYSPRDGASVPAKRCREIRLFRTFLMISASFAACSLKDRDSVNVLGTGKASDTVFGEFRPHVQAPSFPRLRVRCSQISCVQGSAGTVTKLLVPLYACSWAVVTGLYFMLCIHVLNPTHFIHKKALLITCYFEIHTHLYAEKVKQFF